MVPTHAMEVCFVGVKEVDDVPHRLGHANADVERVDDGLSEVFFHSRAT